MLGICAKKINAAKPTPKVAPPAVNPNQQSSIQQKVARVKQPVSVQPKTQPVQPKTETIPKKICDASYPDVCIPPYPPDLDCGEIPYKNFRVVGSDTHRFDGEGDGIGCES